MLDEMRLRASPLVRGSKPRVDHDSSSANPGIPSRSGNAAGKWLGLGGPVEELATTHRRGPAISILWRLFDPFPISDLSRILVELVGALKPSSRTGLAEPRGTPNGPAVACDVKAPFCYDFFIVRVILRSGDIFSVSCPSDPVMVWKGSSVSNLPAFLPIE
ncbi:hypothetical protein H6P81_014142 [Aristolochia fimbriata]|uniref:Uncharacterized protein n=1 Tax=Aristolochia fimbriata TaxID=158543 RepID=A0AAV7EI79_ARIFI|nr:hypothetical protein H6P81_014142 [Aristolochia fimbriata]